MLTQEPLRTIFAPLRLCIQRRNVCFGDLHLCQSPFPVPATPNRAKPTPRDARTNTNDGEHAWLFVVLAASFAPWLPRNKQRVRTAPFALALTSLLAQPAPPSPDMPPSRVTTGTPHSTNTQQAFRGPTGTHRAHTLRVELFLLDHTVHLPCTQGHESSEPPALMQSWPARHTPPISVTAHIASRPPAPIPCFLAWHPY